MFTSALRLKDVEYGLRFARAIGIGSPFGALAGRIYRQLCELGHDRVNESKRSSMSVELNFSGTIS